jgi:hypothetical protein
MLAGTADNVDIGAIIGQAVGGGVAGAIVTFVVGLALQLQFFAGAFC